MDAWLRILVMIVVVVAGYAQDDEWQPAWELAGPIEEGNVEALQQALAAHPEMVNGYVEWGPGGCSHGKPIHLAVIEGKANVVAMLLEHGASIKAVDKYGRQPLYIAIKQDDAEMVKLLLEKGAGPNDDLNGNSPLHEAATAAHAEVVALLLENGAEVNAKNREGATPLRAASHWGGCWPLRELPVYRQTIQLLRQNGGLLTREWSLQDAALAGDLARVKELVEQDADAVKSLDEHEMTALHWAAFGGSRDVSEYLLAQHAEINAEDKESRTPLHLAVAMGHLEIARVLLDRGARDSPLNLAVSAGDREVVLLLLAQDGVPAAGPEGLLHQAVYSGRTEIVRLLLDRGASVDATWRAGTPLHHISPWTTPEIARLLLDRGAEVNVQGQERRTPLHVGVRGGAPIGVLELLLDRGANVNATDENGVTPLLEVCYWRDLAVAKLLVDHGASLTIGRRSPMSVLRYSRVAPRDDALIRFIEEKGAGQ